MWNAQHAHSRMKSGRTKAKWQRKRRNEEMRDDHIGDRGRARVKCTTTSLNLKDKRSCGLREKS